VGTYFFFHGEEREKKRNKTRGDFLIEEFKEKRGEGVIKENKQW
jgi:hypothetical protein